MVQHLLVQVICNNNNYVGYRPLKGFVPDLVYKSSVTRDEYPYFSIGDTYVFQTENDILLRAVKI